MFSIIICSISPDKLTRLKENIHKTIGCEYEILAYDNRQEKCPIAKIYNRGISNAKYPFLFFIHEDIAFRNSGWGNVLARKLLEKDCGVIGFAGTKVKSEILSGWGQIDKYSVCHYYDHDFLTILNSTKDFVPVVAVDGFAFCVRTSVAAEHPFDEKYLKDFHCYDIDFCLALTKYYRNYVCTIVDIAHYSSGNYNRMWYKTTKRIHDEKWNRFLPVSVDGISLTESEKEKVASDFMFRVLRIPDLPLSEKAKLYFSFCTRHKISFTHISKCLQYGVKLLRTIK